MKPQQGAALLLGCEPQLCEQQQGLPQGMLSNHLQPQWQATALQQYSLGQLLLLLRHPGPAEQRGVAISSAAQNALMLLRPPGPAAQRDVVVSSNFRVDLARKRTPSRGQWPLQQSSCKLSERVCLTVACLLS